MKKYSLMTVAFFSLILLVLSSCGDNSVSSTIPEKNISLANTKWKLKYFGIVATGEQREPKDRNLVADYYTIEFGDSTIKGRTVGNFILYGSYKVDSTNSYFEKIEYSITQATDTPDGLEYGRGLGLAREFEASEKILKIYYENSSKYLLMERVK